MTKKLILLLIFLYGGIAGSQIQIQGIILDSISKEALPFVNIAVKGTSVGTSSQLNGKFSITVSNIPVILVFSYVGYNKKEINVEQNHFTKILLNGSGINLNEVIVRSNYDPALQLMKKVVQNGAANNPEKNGSFSYTSYNKMVFSIETDSLRLSEEKKKAKDPEEKKMYSFFEKQHLFLSECVTEKKFKNKYQQKETILSSRVSGFSSPMLSLFSTQLQSFHFYQDEISLGDVKYAGPVSAFGLNVYRYALKDTFYLGKDSVFAIEFHPKNENNLQAMKGVLQIHSDGYAIYNVIAEPFAETENGFGIKISQQYQKINNQKWFPDEFTTKLTLYNVKIGEFPVIGSGYGKLSSIQLNPAFTKNEFDEFEVKMNTENSSSALIQNRSDSLSKKEKETYRVIDSLGTKHHLDKKMMALQSLINGYVPLKFLDWDISKLINYNDYEGFRVGLGLRTNHKISKWFSLGGYVAYGFGDRAFKYGSDLNILFSQKRNMELNFSIIQDLDASSDIESFEKSRTLYANGYSMMFANRFDSVLKYECRFSMRALRHFKISVFGNNQYRNGFDNYKFVGEQNENTQVLFNSYSLTEAGAEIKWLLHEKFIQTPFGNISKGSDWPVIIFRYTRGISGVLNGNFNYTRFTLDVKYQYHKLRIGNFYVNAKAGILNGNAPYHLWFNPSGTYRSLKNITVFSMDGFETMRTNEFLANLFASLHFRYQLPKPIVNGKKFRPMISITYAGTIGNSENSEIHQNLNFQKLDHLYNESGIVIDNLLKSGISGIGIGFFYRWGYYQFALPKDNFALKISLALALG